jgi:hypothetical protein
VEDGGESVVELPVLLIVMRVGGGADPGDSKACLILISDPDS